MVFYRRHSTLVNQLGSMETGDHLRRLIAVQKRNIDLKVTAQVVRPLLCGEGLSGCVEYFGMWKRKGKGIVGVGA